MLRLGSGQTWRTRDAVVGILALLVATACERTEPVPARKDTAVPVVPPPESVVVAPPRPSAWDSSAGPALFVAGASPAEAAIVAPTYTDSASLDTTKLDAADYLSVRLDLFAGGRIVGSARINAVTPPTRSDSCANWPIATLASAPRDTTASPWTVAFKSGHAREVALDSIEALPSADSSRLAADIARIASALPGDTAAVFRGLPFVVKKAWRSHGLNPQVLAAIVVRNVNQEANPRQEQLLLLAERDSTLPTGRYAPVFQERVTGLEETIEAADLVGMVLLGSDRRPTVVVTRDAATGSSYALVEKIGGRWQRRWASIYAGC